MVIELKATEFQPEYAGKLNFYLAAVDGEIKHENDAPTIGILLCKTKNRAVVEYALKNVNTPMGVSEYQITESLPENLQSALPSVEEIEAELAELENEKPTHQIVFLVDEIESHLHPKWQRKIIPALLKAVKSLAKNTQVQIVAATHSPLIMASAEPLFDPEIDAWFDFDLVGSQVKLTRRDYEKKGDILNWLTSDAFDLNSGRAEEFE